MQIALDSVTTAGWLILEGDIDDRRVKSGLIGNRLGALALSTRRQNAPMQLNPIAIEDFE